MFTGQLNETHAPLLTVTEDDEKVTMTVDPCGSGGRLQQMCGYDPEIGASTTDANGYVFGLDNGRYPSPFTCTFGLNISF